MHHLCDDFFSNIVKNIEVNVFFKTSLKHRIVKQKVRCFTQCFRFQKVHTESELNKQGFTAIFNLFKIVTKNIADMHREHDVSDFFKHHLKIALLRIGKHCIVKKSEHRPPLQTTSSICIPIHYWIHIVFMTLDTAILPFQKFTPGCLQPKSCATIILSPPVYSPPSAGDCCKSPHH